MRSGSAIARRCRAAASGLEAVIERVASEVLPRSLSHSHARSFPFIDGSGLEAGVAAAVLAAALDANLGGGAGGVRGGGRGLALAGRADRVPSRDRPLHGAGAHMANLTGLACARARALPAAREHGVDARLRGRLRLRAGAQLDRARLRSCSASAARLSRVDRCRRRCWLSGRPARARDRDGSRRRRHRPLPWWVRRERRAPARSIRSTRSPTSAPSTGLVHIDGAYGAPAAAAPTSGRALPRPRAR